MGKSERHAATQWEWRDSEGMSATTRESERRAGTSWDGRDSDIKPTTMGDSERHVATPWRRRTVRDSQQPEETMRDMKNSMGPERQ